MSLFVEILLVLPLISVVLATAALIVTFLSWKNKYWSWCSRLHYTLVVLAALAFIWFLNYWNLLGYHF